MNWIGVPGFQAAMENEPLLASRAACPTSWIVYDLRWLCVRASLGRSGSSMPMIRVSCYSVKLIGTTGFVTNLHAFALVGVTHGAIDTGHGGGVSYFRRALVFRPARRRSSRRRPPASCFRSVLYGLCFREKLATVVS
jgi:hypothetical protein